MAEVQIMDLVINWTREYSCDILAKNLPHLRVSHLMQGLTDISRHLFSLIDPMQPKKATTIIMEPTMTRTLPSVRKGRLRKSTP